MQSPHRRDKIYYERLVNSQNFFSPYLTQEDLSRLGREYNETFTYLRRIFPALGVRFIAINDNIDTAKEAVTGDISVSFKGVMNDEYCRDISVKVTSLKSSGKSRTFVPKIRQ